MRLRSMFVSLAANSAAAVDLAANSAAAVNACISGSVAALRPRLARGRSNFGTRFELCCLILGLRAVL